MGKAAIQERPEEKAVEAKERQARTCQHHWLIETPQGAVSRGRCKHCGEERDFRNSATDHLWEDESGASYTPWRGMRTTARPLSDDEASVSGKSGGGILAV
jgi:hypothetical protein